MTFRDLALTTVVERITAYLSSGGLFNPELADRDAVRDLLIDARDALLAESEGEPHTICKHWCGKVHCEPPRYCFYRKQTMADRELPAAAAGQLPFERGQNTARRDASIPATSAQYPGHAAPSVRPPGSIDQRDRFGMCAAPSPTRIERASFLGNPHLCTVRTEELDRLEAERDALQAKLESAQRDADHFYQYSGRLLEQLNTVQELANKETLSAAYWKAKAAQSASAVVEAANELLDADDMRLHNEAIFKGKWKKGSKAWSGEFIERKAIDATVKLRALLRPTANATPRSGSSE